MNLIIETDLGGDPDDFFAIYLSLVGYISLPWGPLSSTTWIDWSPSDRMMEGVMTEW